MGVPAFFRWLSRKYPSVIVECVEQKQTDEHGNPLYDDMTQPNPNKVEFDNLYLDMNGIIHPCTHPEDKPAPKDEDEMMVAIFECIDRLMNIVRPRKLLYMAIDGVAPRAKMNQQRSRRFRASKEAAEKAAEVQKIRDELRAKGCILPPEKEKGAHFDSNCITPGTPFMDRLSKCLQYYVHDRMNNNPGWKGLKIILSDANVPGEGEHKIMDYIRKQRAQPDHDPNTHHVLCGADADLIMLGLATHETHFTIIREEFLPNKERPCDICQIMGHEMKDCTGLQSERDINRTPPPPGAETQYIFVRLNVLKEYLAKELDMPNLPFKYDFERVIDDWVFMCFFVGNDFLPHLPSLEIRENAIDRLVTLYKKCVYKTKGYLTDSGSVTVDRVELIMTDLGYAEDEIFRQRKVTEDRFKERNKRMKLQKEREQRPNFEQMNKSQFAPTPLGRGITPQAIQNPRQEAAHFRMFGNSSNQQQSNSNNDQNRRGQKRKADEPLTPAAVEEAETPDEVRLWEDGFKDRYYESKFDVAPQNMKFRQTVAWEYVRGLCWVLKYYYQGCASWEWYFPYHYAPFASDFKGLSNVNTHFDRGTPFKPLQQLMGVFPAASRNHVPPAFAELMVDPKSPIIDFYPIDFHIDLNGKKFAWQGVALLPFVDEKRLFKATDPKVPSLTHEERIIEVKERQTAAFLKGKILEIIKVYAISIEQVFSVTCDNGANMLAAVRQLKQEYEMEHFSWALHEQSDQTDAEQMEQDLEEHKLTAALNSELQENLNLVRCAVHTLQLAILDVVNKSNEDVKMLTEMARKCKTIKFKSAFELQGARYPPVWGATRWGGIYEMVSSFLEQRTFFDKLAEQFPEMDLSLSWTFAEHYEEAFKPLFICTKKMEAAHVSLSDFYLEWMITIQKVKKLQSNPFSEPLVQTLTSRLANLRGSRAFKMALYFDPRLNFAGSTLFNSEEKEEIQGYIVETWKRIQRLQSKPATLSSESDSAQVSIPQDDENDQMITELFGGTRMDMSISNDSNFNQQLKSMEVEPRKNFNFDVWKFWVDRKTTHPELSAVAAVVLATPSNQVSVERAFSALALVLTNARSTLGEEAMSNILMIKLNKTIFEKILIQLSQWKADE